MSYESETLAELRAIGSRLDEIIDRLDRLIELDENDREPPVLFDYSVPCEEWNHDPE